MNDPKNDSNEKPSIDNPTFTKELEKLLDQYCFINESGFSNDEFAQHVVDYIHLLCGNSGLINKVQEQTKNNM